MLNASNEWFKQSEYDVGTADAMYEKGRYVYCVFMCHLAIEKALKGHIVNKLSIIPPKSHNLIYLLDMLEWDIPKERLGLFVQLNNASIPTRYPSELDSVLAQFNQNICLEILNKTKDTLLWMHTLLAQ